MINHSAKNTARVVKFTFNPFSENTYLIGDATGECIVIDPGCFDATERERLRTEIEERNWQPVRLLNTHCHIDHVFGNRFVSETWDLPLEIHQDELPMLNAVPLSAQMYGIPYPEPSPGPGNFLQENTTLRFGETELELRLVPGHSPASLAFVCHGGKFVIAGDALFQRSIGRTDLPGGDHQTLLDSIREQLFTLPDDYTVYAGHGPETTIGEERRLNPFVGEGASYG